VTRGIHWFRNDLRLRDNLALSELAERTDEWAALFVVDPEIIRRADGDAPRLRFLFDSLRRLERDLGDRGIVLQIRRGRPESVLPLLMAKTGARVVSWNAAPTPMGRRRDERVSRGVENAGGRVIEVFDHTVFGSEEITTKSGGPYRIYSAYRNEWWRQWERGPRRSAPRSKLPRSSIPGLDASENVELPSGPQSGAGPRLPTGGERAANHRLKTFLSNKAHRYHLDRDTPALDGTSKLSPHLRFGTLSARRCFTLGLDAIESDPSRRAGVEKWLDELVWREFYHAVMANSPHVLSRSYRPEYDQLDWSGSDANFEAWCEGRTGYPFVDAGMRQLRKTGWMHNRVRMVVASFLTKDLLVDWRRGERFFAESLVDWDPASNNGGWQWSASTGTDAQPYFRIFNPVAQGQKWDPDGRYVRRWVPELSLVETRWIHEPWKAPRVPRYIAPIVDHAIQRERALEEFRRVRALARVPDERAIMGGGE